MVLAEMLEDPESSPHDIISDLKEWSRTHDEIIGWINELRGKFGADLRLVIWDDAGFNFPWEMLWLDRRFRLRLAGRVAGQPRRRRPVDHPDREDVRDPYSDDPVHCAGQVLAYVDEAMDG